MSNNDLIVFSGRANLKLSEKICKYMDLKLGRAVTKNFSDGEIRIEIGENIRGCDVYIIQPTCSPVNNNLMELLLMIDACMRSSVKRITAVIPYYGYARQDKKVAPRVPISAKLVADLIVKAGADRVITMELHAGQIQGFFNKPVDNLFAAPLFYPSIKKLFGTGEHLVLVSPDAGGVERARALAKRLDAKLAIIDKRRDEPNKARAMNVIGDVGGKTAVILDDMVDTAGTLTEAAEAVLDKGAKEAYVCATHPVLSGKAIERLTSSRIKKLITTDTIPLRAEADDLLQAGRIEILSVDNLFGEAIKRCHVGDSVTSLFV